MLRDFFIERVHEIIVLGVVFDRTFSFNGEIDFVVANANTMFGFFMRICTDFNAAPVFFSL